MNTVTNPKTENQKNTISIYRITDTASNYVCSHMCNRTCRKKDCTQQTNWGTLEIKHIVAILITSLLKIRFWLWSVPFVSLVFKSKFNKNGPIWHCQVTSFNLHVNMTCAPREFFDEILQICSQTRRKFFKELVGIKVSLN